MLSFTRYKHLSSKWRSTPLSIGALNMQILKTTVNALNLIISVPEVNFIFNLNVITELFVTITNSSVYLSN